MNVVVGGRAIRDADHTRDVGADGWATSPDGMHALLMEWQRASVVR